jgi:hypothetical protein
MRLDDHRKCGHGKVFNERCIECERVSLVALIRAAERNIERWNRDLAELHGLGELFERR